MRVLLGLLLVVGMGVVCDGAFLLDDGSSPGRLRAAAKESSDDSADTAPPLPEGVYSLGTRLPDKRSGKLQSPVEVEGFLNPVDESLEFSSKGLQLLAPPVAKPQNKGKKQANKPAPPDPVMWSRVDRKLSARWKDNGGLIVFDGEVVGVGHVTGKVTVTGKTGQMTQGTFRLILRVRESDRKGDADWRIPPQLKPPFRNGLYHEPPPWLLADKSVPFDVAKFFERPPDNQNGAVDVLEAFETLTEDLRYSQVSLRNRDKVLGYRFMQYWKAWDGNKITPVQLNSVTPYFVREIAKPFDKLYPQLQQSQRRPTSVLPVGIGFERSLDYLTPFRSANDILCLKVKVVLESGATRGTGKRRITEAIEILDVALKLSHVPHRRGATMAVHTGLNSARRAVNFCVPRILAQGDLTVADCEQLIRVLKNRSRDCVEALPEMLRAVYVDLRVLLHELIRRTGEFDLSRLNSFRYPRSAPHRHSAARHFAENGSLRLDRLESVDSMTLKDEAREIAILNREIGRLLAMDREPLHKWVKELSVAFRTLFQKTQFIGYLAMDQMGKRLLLHEADLRGLIALACIRRFRLKKQQNPESLKQAVESAGLKWPINDPLNPGQPLGFIRHPDPKVDYRSHLGTLWKSPGNLPSVYSVGRNGRDDTRNPIDSSDTNDDLVYLVQVPEMGACLRIDRSLMKQYAVQLSAVSFDNDDGQRTWKMKIGKTFYVAGKSQPDQCLAPVFEMFGVNPITIREQSQSRQLGVPRLLAGLPISSINLQGAGNGDVLAQSLNTFHGKNLLQELSLDQTAITDAGLKTISGLPSLTRISLIGAKITDSGLMQLASAKTTYTSIDLGQTAITDESLATLSQFSALKSLGLGQTKITDAGLEHLSKLKHLQDLSLVRCSLSDNGARHLKPLTNLQSLDLGLVPITDEGLVHLKGLTNLQDLNLNFTHITDAGLVHLKGMTKLQELALASTTITGKGFVHLKDLPTLQTLSLEGCEKLGDQLGVQLGQFSKLESLKLNHANIRDQQLTGLGSLGQLTSLDLRVNPELTDAGLAHLKGLSKLKTLSVFFCPKITGPGLQHLATLEQLQTLNLGNNPGLTDAGLQHLARIKSLKKINLSFCQKITIEGVKHLKGLQQLEVLNLQFCNKIPREEIPSLKQALPKCRILHGAVIKR